MLPAPVFPALGVGGAATGLRRYLKENGGVQSMDAAKTALLEASGLAENHKLTQLILNYYEMILDGCSLAKLTAKTDRIKHENMQAVV